MWYHSWGWGDNCTDGSAGVTILQDGYPGVIILQEGFHGVTILQVIRKY